MIKIEITHPSKDRTPCNAQEVEITGLGFWFDSGQPVRLEAVPCYITDHEYAIKGTGYTELFTGKGVIDLHGDQSYQRGIFAWPKMLLVTELCVQCMPLRLAADASLVVGEKTMLHFDGAEYLTKTNGLQEAIDTGICIYPRQNFCVRVATNCMNGWMASARLGGWLLREVC